MKRLSFFSKLILFLSSYLPLAVIFLIIDFDKPTYPFFKNQIYALILLIIIILLPVLIFYMIRHFLKRPTGWQKMKIVSVENMNTEILSYIFTYIIPFLDFPDDRRVAIVIFLLIIIGILYTRSDMLGINPLLSIFGYHIIKIELKNDNWPQSKEGIFISKFDYYDIKQSKIIDAIQMHNELYLLKGIER